MTDKLIEELRDLMGYLSENGEYADAETICQALLELHQCRDRMRWVPEIPVGAIENGRTLMDRLENHYNFECEGGSLAMCSEWQDLRRCFEYMADSLAALPQPPQQEQQEQSE